MAKSRNRRVSAELDKEIKKFQSKVNEQYGIPIKYTDACRALARMFGKIDVVINVEKTKKKEAKGTFEIKI